MTKRYKKKLMKRCGFFRYSEYKEWKRILDFGVKHGGQSFCEWFVGGKYLSEDGVDVLLITTSKSGRQIKDMKIATGCIPSWYPGDDYYHYQPEEQDAVFNARFHNDELCEHESEVERYQRKWLEGLE